MANPFQQRLDYYPDARFEMATWQQRSVPGTILVLPASSPLSVGKIRRILLCLVLLPVELAALVLDYVLPYIGNTTVFRKAQN